MTTGHRARPPVAFALGLIQPRISCQRAGLTSSPKAPENCAPYHCYRLIKGITPATQNSLGSSVRHREKWDCTGTPDQRG